MLQRIHETGYYIQCSTALFFFLRLVLIQYKYKAQTDLLAVTKRCP